MRPSARRLLSFSRPRLSLSSAASLRVLAPLCAILAVPSSSASSLSFREMSARAGPRIRQDGTTLIVEPKEKHTATIIWMHGLGDTAEGWIDVASMFAPSLPHVKFILPTAGTLPVTLNGGFPMPAWYDIENLSGDRKTERCNGIQASRERVLKLIAKEEEKHGIKPERIVLAGFSQGGAMSYYTGLSFEKKLGGILVLSGYMPLEGELKPTAEAKSTPLMALHGDADGVVRLSWGEDGVTQAKAKGLTEVSFKVYEGLPHSADPEELDDALAFLKKALPAV